MLARLANDTGGRLTRETNDLSLGFARAQRDLGCRYTIGFFLPDDEPDRPRRIAIHVKRPGLRAIHPEHYRIRSESEQHSAALSAAFFSPDTFDTGYLRSFSFPLHPTTPKTWEVLIAVSFPVKFDDAGSPIEIDFGGVLTRGPRVAHSFNRRVTLRPLPGATADERRFTFLEPVDLGPGSYRLTVVRAAADGETRPGAHRIAVELPEITRKEMMLVRPILGRPRDRNIVVRGEGPTSNRKSLSPQMLALLDVVAGKGSFEPLLVQRAEDLEELLARNKACLIGSRPPEGNGTIQREVLEEQGLAIELAPVPLELQRTGKVWCQNVFETLPDERIDPGRYVFEASVEDLPKEDQVIQELPFAVQDEARAPSD